MVLLDDQRRHVEVNGAYLQLLEYPRSALIGRPVYEFVLDGPLASTQEWRAAMRQRQFSGVAPMLRADGVHVTVEFAGHPAIVTGKQLVLFVALAAARGNRRLGDVRVTPLVGVLTERQLQVVELLALGYSGPEIAEQLHVAHNTVRTHVHNAMTKLATRSRAQLVAKALGENVLWTGRR